jgi:hypothetical protein
VVHDSRRLVTPEPIASDPAAYELISGWVRSRSIFVMSRTGTGLDQNPGIWGTVLVGLANNIAKSTQAVTGADPAETLGIIKEVLDQQWGQNLPPSGDHYSNA